MKLNDPDVWNVWVETNKDAYGSAVIRYAERWAGLMEKRIAQGAKLDDIAEETSHEADTEGITGFMYGAAVSVLASCWGHGDELRLWHNEAYGVSREESTKKKGVVNPAIVTVEAGSVDEVVDVVSKAADELGYQVVQLEGGE